ncbi:MAG: hypothetical protein LUG49_08690 [Oscillospiraceae bacterium]|nr:hypothetical protein [Oscillospiraceae bacterium]
MVKRLLCVIISVLISVVLLTISAIADDNTEETASPVASIGGDEYGTLEEAITAASAASSDVTITLLSDVELDTSLTIPASTYTITLDLNGCTISQSEDFADDKIIYVLGILTIMDGKENGRIVADNQYGIMVSGSSAVLNINSGTIVATNRGVHIGAQGVLNISGGTITSSWIGVLVYNGTLNISGDNTVIGSVENTTYGVYLDQSGCSEKVNITGGHVSGKSYGIYIRSNPHASVTISGGYIVGKNYSAVNIYQYGSISVDGGYFSSDVTEFCTSGYACEELSEEVNSCSYQVVEATSENAVLSVTSSTNGEITYHSTLAIAVSSASEGDTITILKDTTVSETVTVDKSLEIDLYGHTISGSVSGRTTAMLYVSGSDVSLTISDSSEEQTGCITNTYTSISYAILVANYASLTVKGGTTSGYRALRLATYASATVEGGTLEGTNNGAVYMEVSNGLVITGGTITSANSWGIFQSSSSSVTVSGGTVYGKTYGIQQTSANISQRVTLNGGEVSGGTCALKITKYLTVPEDSTVIVTGDSVLELDLTYSSYSNIAIAGGYFSSALEEDWCAEGYIPTEVITEGDYAGYYSAMKGIYLGISSDTESTIKIPATIEYGEDEAIMYVLVSGDYIGTDGYYSKEAYPVTSATYAEAGHLEAGYLFAGWYSLSEDGISYKALTEFPTGTDAYAKFVDANVLTTGAQISAGTESTYETTDMRFVSTVDVLDYSLVGFNITIGEVTVTVKTNTVYSSIVGTDGETEYVYEPQSFCSASNYFDVYTLMEIPASVFDSDITAEAYWVTLDGTTVYGESNTFVISSMISESGSESE